MKNTIYLLFMIKDGDLIFFKFYVSNEKNEITFSISQENKSWCCLFADLI